MDILEEIKKYCTSEKSQEEMRRMIQEGSLEEIRAKFEEIRSAKARAREVANMIEFVLVVGSHYVTVDVLDMAAEHIRNDIKQARVRVKKELAGEQEEPTEEPENELDKEVAKEWDCRKCRNNADGDICEECYEGSKYAERNNGDVIRSMSNELLPLVLTCPYYNNENPEESAKEMPCMNGSVDVLEYGCYRCKQDWLGKKAENKEK